MKPYQVLVLGTGSHVGKSLVATALCRILADRGFRVAPFKAQNMALNSAVTDEGAEIGRAQWLQAVAARVRPQARMNPVLLKPVREKGSQVILLGQPQGVYSTQAYFKFWPKAAKAAQASWASLAADHDALVMEGAGSPAEVNLAHRDLANLETARFSRAPWILVVDIERGGSFAAIVGTLALVPAWLRRRCLGVVFNKFRGDPRLLDSGLRWLKARGITPLGVIPYLPGLVLEEEDSLGLPSSSVGSVPKKALQIEVIRHRFIANFNDALALTRLPGVALRWANPGAERSRPDLVILPGSKDTVADLEDLVGSGEAKRLEGWRRQGTWVLGVCGGFQMLGRQVDDPAGLDSGRRGSRHPGLGWLDLHTRMGPQKVLAGRDLDARTRLGRLPLQGYEIHHGRTTTGPGVRVEARGPKGEALLVSSRNGRVWGTYLHGIFDAPEFRDAFLGALAKSVGKRYKKGGRSQDQAREQSLKDWAAHVQIHVDLSFLPRRPAR